MPVYSMTGYASAQHSTAHPAPAAGPRGAEKDTEKAAEKTTDQAAQGHLGLEIRSVNSRFLDLSFRLSEDLRQFEPLLRELLVAKLKRGKVEVRAAVESAASSGVAEPSPKLLQRLNAIQDNIKAWLPHATALSVADVIRLSGDDQGRGEQGPPRDWSEVIVPLADQVLQELLQARTREGERLATMLHDRIGQLRTLAAKAVPLVPQLVAQQRQRFVERWREALSLCADGKEGGMSPEAAQDRALTEATAFAIRIDVAEEITRINSHLDELERLIKKGGEIGKRLDFLIQELHREANTMGSKSAALELTHVSVDMKVLIEQMREQVQNIE